MKNQAIKLFLFFFLIILNQSVFGVIAYPYPIEIVQPDGSKLTIIQKGDEHIKMAQTIDGYSIMRNSKGVFEYAMLDSKGDMVSSGIKAKNFSDRDNSDNKFLSKVKKGITYSQSQFSIMKSMAQDYQNSSIPAFSSKGSRKLLCILIGFTDKAFTKTKADFEALFNQTNYTVDGATGSVKDYYTENSYGQLDLTVTVAGPYNATFNMAYYGANKDNQRGEDVNARELVSEAILLANSDVDYSQFDGDNDGNVDGVYVIYAGYGEEASGGADAIWAHAWNVTPQLLDGKWVSKYSCSPELRGNSGTGITRIGVICHEFGHALGAVDFYDTDYEKSGGEFDGTGNWDLMAGGSWNNYGATPAHHNAFTKVYAYNWATATEITSSSTITLNNAAQNKNSFYIINSSTANEFFMIENRQNLLFDYHLPGHGMIIYHVDKNYMSMNSGKINAGPHQGFYPICANATTNPDLLTAASYGNINKDGCPFPGTFGVTTIGDYTVPNLRSWAGENTFKLISNISENTTNNTVSFKVSITTGIDPNDIAVNYLSQNYPNPFDQSTNIDFKLVKPGKVNLTIYNSLGQVVDVIVDEYLSVGDYSKKWTPKGVASGIYFYQLKVDGVKETKRLIKK